jgi:transposase
MEVITSVQRRRRWSQSEKERIVAASLEPGAVASAVARAAGIHTSQLFRWRRDLCEPPRPAFAAVAIRSHNHRKLVLSLLCGIFPAAAQATCSQTPSFWLTR